MPPGSDDDRGDRGEADPERSRHGGGEDEPEGAARTGDPREEALVACRRTQGQEGESDGERRARERGQVVDPEEGRLALERPLPLELVHESGELEQAPAGRGGAPGGDRPEEERDVAPGAQEERNGRGEDGVLGELRGRDEVRQEAVVRGAREPVERRDEDDRDDRRDRDPDRSPGP